MFSQMAEFLQRMKTMQNREYLYYIDKTKSLEEGISRFPSIYIEGNAACGKSVAVGMLLEKHPEVTSCMLELDLEFKDPEKLFEKLTAVKKQMETKTVWLVLENMPENMNPELADLIEEIVRKITGDSRVIFVSRSKPQKKFLNFLWKNKMGLIPMEKLLFSREEIRSFVKEKRISLSAEEIYEKTGGWPGCVAVLSQLAEAAEHKTIEEFLWSSEVKNYILGEIIADITEEEKTLLNAIAGCPWVNEELLGEVWNIGNEREQLENFQRKGFLTYEREKQRWKLAPLFQNYIAERSPVIGEENVWYENHGYIAEALWCVKKAGTEQLYHEYMLKYFDQVYSLGLVSEKVLKWTGKTPQECYLRGVYYYSVQQFSRLRREIENLQKIQEKDFKTKEILLNLCYMNPQITTDEWLEMAENALENGKKLKIYHLLGNSVTYLCGIRDLSGLFACSSKEEKRKARFWKTAFGEVEWKCYQLARIDYYLETVRRDAITEEDWNLLRDVENVKEPWQIRMAKLYLLCKLQRIQYDETYINRIEILENSLREGDNQVCAGVAECISSLYAPWYGVREKMSKWLRYTIIDSNDAVTEENYVVLYCRAKGYLLLNQFERAEKLLKKLIPYLQNYRRNRFLAEVLFQYAMINWGKDLKGQAVKNAIESFLVCANSRYVRFYAGYGKKGQEVLEAYIEWQRSNSPEGWSHKKKYNYGNVLRMPLEDYLDTVLRAAKKVSRSGKKFPEEYIEERLTMMETIILQDIGRGMSNAEICQELGLKLPTVKGHIYNLYKKLGVNSRGQAVVKGKELGVLE